jgi:hypothetical protein
METVGQKEALRQMVTRLYDECEISVEPLFPKLLIRVLPKYQKRGRIWLPDGIDQNKPTWEAMVLKTYRPFYQKIYLSQAHWVSDDPDPEVRYTQKVESLYQPGDHILFPHIAYGAVPIWPLDEGKGDYRLIPEEIIIGKLEYERQPTLNWLTDVIFETTHFGYDTAQNILKKADVIRKDVEAKTISGK